MKATVFLGGGRITSALVSGLRLSRYRAPIVVFDRHPAKLRRLQRQFGIIPETELNRAVSSAGILIIAVRPESVPDLLQQIGSAKRRLVPVSVAAGVPLKKLRALLPAPAAWVRAMPSPVARVGRGLTALVFDKTVRTTERNQVQQLFGRVGDVVEIPEKDFDAFTVTYSSSHGYHALATLAGAAQRLGLSRKTALLAASHALADGVTSFRNGKLPLAHLIHEAATPGGIAATVMFTMDKAGYARIVERGLRAGVSRARKHAN